MRDDLLDVWEEVRTTGSAFPDTDAVSRDELAYRLRQQGLFADFGLFALRANSLEKTLQKGTEVAAEALGVELCKFLRYRSRQDDLLVVAGVGWRDGVVGSATLRADLGSPSGYAFKTNRPTLSNDLQGESRFRTPALLQEHGVRGALNVPVEIDGTLYGVLEVDSRNFGRFSEADIVLLQGLSHTLAIVLSRDIAARKLEVALERERLWAGEMRHRVKNLFAVITAVASTSQKEAEQAGNPAAAMTIFLERLSAFSRASDAGLPSIDLAEDGLQRRFDPVAATRMVLEPFAGRVLIRGAVAPQPREDLVTVALVVHELATNATKYGALSRDVGTVEIEWSEIEGEVTFVWAEKGGPAIASPPSRQGYGHKLINRILRPTGGSFHCEWTAAGLIARVILRGSDD